MAELLAKPSKVVKVVNHPALSLSDAPGWYRELQSRAGIAARAIQFAVLTAARS